MRDRIFIDTNILVYFISDEKKKKLLAKDIIFSSDQVYISSQVISEFINVCFTKKLLKTDEILFVVDQLIEALRFESIDELTIKKAIHIKKKTLFSFWDSLIIASALENDCAVLFSEDMQDGQLIEKSLTIVNPFK
jgi:predicted nucleic acid-binding protein